MPCKDGRICSQSVRRKDELYFSLTRSDKDNREYILPSKGEKIPIAPNFISGHLDIADVRGNSVLFAGWAADVKNSQSAGGIIFFVNGDYFHAGDCNAFRPDVADYYGNDSLLNSGFSFIFPLSKFDDIGKSKVRVFAISNKGGASELPYHAGYSF